MKTELTGVAQTLLIPARVRAYETKRPDALLKDPWAVEIIEKLDLEKSNKDHVSSGTQIGTVLRTLLIDKKVTEFIQKHPDGIVVNLGCGLDARYKRLCPASILWFDLDIEESIQVRKRFFEDTDNYKMFCSSMFDYAWMNLIPKGKPILIIFEGVSMYFPQSMVKPFIQEVFRQFPQADIVFDVLSKMNAENSDKHPDVRKYNVNFKWGIDSGTELLKWQKGMRLVSEESYMVQGPLFRWPLILRLLRWLPAIRRMGRVVHIRYEV